MSPLPTTDGLGAVDGREREDVVARLGLQRRLEHARCEVADDDHRGLGRIDEDLPHGVRHLRLQCRLGPAGHVGRVADDVLHERERVLHGLIRPRDLVRHELVVHLGSRRAEVDVLEDVRHRPADVDADRVRGDPRGLKRVAGFVQLVPGLGSAHARLLEGRDVVPHGRLVSPLEHDPVLRPVDRADVRDGFPEVVDDRLAQVVDRLKGPLLHEALHEPGLAHGGDVGRIAAFDSGRQQRCKVVAAGRVLDVDVRVELVEAVDHGLERLLLLAAPDRHHRDVAGDVLAALGAATVVASTTPGRDECQHADDQGQYYPSLSHPRAPSACLVGSSA